MEHRLSVDFQETIPLACAPARVCRAYCIGIGPSGLLKGCGWVSILSSWQRAGFVVTLKFRSLRAARSPAVDGGQ